jgi:hypothetical protein
LNQVKVYVYQFTLYDITTDTKRKSHRWATLDAIESIGGEALKNTRTEVEASAVVTDIPGMTERDFNPHKRTVPLQTVTV